MSIESEALLSVHVGIDPTAALRAGKNLAGWRIIKIDAEKLTQPQRECLASLHTPRGDDADQVSSVLWVDYRALPLEVRDMLCEPTEDCLLGILDRMIE